jgi:hypothetical protein
MSEGRREEGKQGDGGAEAAPMASGCESGQWGMAVLGGARATRDAQLEHALGPHLYEL